MADIVGGLSIGKTKKGDFNSGTVDPRTAINVSGQANQGGPVETPGGILKSLGGLAEGTLEGLQNLFGILKFGPQRFQKLKDEAAIRGELSSATTGVGDVLKSQNVEGKVPQINKVTTPGPIVEEQNVEQQVDVTKSRKFKKASTRFLLAGGSSQALKDITELNSSTSFSDFFSKPAVASFTSESVGKAAAHFKRTGEFDITRLKRKPDKKTGPTMTKLTGLAINKWLGGKDLSKQEQRLVDKATKDSKLSPRDFKERTTARLDATKEWLEANDIQITDSLLKRLAVNDPFDFLSDTSGGTIDAPIPFDIWLIEAQKANPNYSQKELEVEYDRQFPGAR